MKKFLLLAMAAGLFAACGNETTEELEHMSTRAASASFYNLPLTSPIHSQGVACTVNYSKNSCKYYIDFLEACGANNTSDELVLDGDNIKMMRAGLQIGPTWPAAHTHEIEWCQGGADGMQLSCNTSASCPDMAAIKTWIASKLGTTVDQISEYHVSLLFKDTDDVYKLKVRVSDLSHIFVGTVDLPITQGHTHSGGGSHGGGGYGG